MTFLKQFYTTPRLYLGLAILIVLFASGFFIALVFLLAKIAFIVFIALVLFDFVRLFLQRNGTIHLRRVLPDRLSNGDENNIEIYITNAHTYPIQVEIIDEIPEQFQIRDFGMKFELSPGEERVVKYALKPKTRGEYIFGCTNVIYATKIGFLGKHLKVGADTVVPVYPSFISMRKFELLAISNNLSEVGIKRVRKSGMHNEFDRIKEYVKGDNYRTINWKSTAKKGKLMVNLYQEEHSQRVYHVIDMGRTMEMPFNGMSLLDYAINASLVLSKVIMQKSDKVGLIPFNKIISGFLTAEKKKGTMNNIMELLYRQKTDFHESNYALLTATVLKRVTTRSLIIFYTNFESLESLDRNLKYFKLLSKRHLLLMVIFENTEIDKALETEARTLQDIYTKTIAEKFLHDKKLITKELMKNGILSVLTKPENLSGSLLNRYLELKSTGRF